MFPEEGGPFQPTLLGPPHSLYCSPSHAVTVHFSWWDFSPRSFRPGFQSLIPAATFDRRTRRYDETLRELISTVNGVNEEETSSPPPSVKTFK